MIAYAVSKYIKIAPRKARIVADVVRNKNVDDAISILMSINKKASGLIIDTVKSAANNAKRKYPEQKYESGDMKISKIVINEGPSLTRFRAASMGRATTIKKRTSHIVVEIDVDKEKYEKRLHDTKKKTAIPKPDRLEEKSKIVKKKEKKLVAAKGSK